MKVKIKVTTFIDTRQSIVFFFLLLNMNIETGIAVL